MADLTWTTSFRGEDPSQDPEPITKVQPNPSTQQPSQPSTSLTQATQDATYYRVYLETYLQSQLKVLRDKLRTVARIVWGLNVPLRLRSYTKTTLPSASIPGSFIYVSNESGGPIPAFSDGTNWRRVSDRAVVS